MERSGLTENILIAASAIVSSYLVLETLTSISNGGMRLPLGSLFLAFGLSDLDVTVILASMMFVELGLYIYWLFKYRPGIISKLKKEAKPEEVKVEKPILKEFEAKKEAIIEKLVPTDSGAYNFVNIVQLDRELPDVFAGIVKDEETGGYKYVVIEPTLTDREKQFYKEIRKLLIDELDVSLWSIKNRKVAQQYLAEKVRRIVKRYGYKLAKPTLSKLQYYFNRDFIGMGKIEPLLHDYLIEDISCDGPGVPIYVWHRDYESIPTNIVFENDEELNTFVSKLAYIAGKHISLANPIVDASLPDGSRVQMTYGKEVTQKGSTFTIRKFKPDPLTIVDLLKYNTMNSELAAYLWYLVEKRLSILVAGGTASGKTTTLNALSMFIVPGQKIVSVEDTPELNLPHENWIQSVARTVGTTGEITLFDLLRAALRQRPDIIIVGEVRGEEAFTLFQAIASVSGDTPILVREDGRMRLDTIGNIVDSYYSANLERVPVYVPSLEVLSFDRLGRVSFRQVRYVLRHRVKKIYRVKYMGGEIRATGSHSVFVFTSDGEVIEKPVSMLGKDDIMVSFYGLAVESKPRNIILSGNGSALLLTNQEYKVNAKGGASLINSSMHSSIEGEGMQMNIATKEDHLLSASLIWSNLISRKWIQCNELPIAPLMKLKELLGSSIDIELPMCKTVPRHNFAKLLCEVISGRSVPFSPDAVRLIRRIISLLESNLTAVPIISVKEESYDGYVYDVSVPETEAFFGGIFPIALHNTGHGGLGTVHADSVETVITRLTSEPMKIPKSLLGSTLDCIVMQLKVRIGERSVRRVVNVTEVVGHDPRNDQIILNDAYRWDPVNDKFIFSGRSRLFEKITQRYGNTPEQIRKDIEYRKTFLDWLVMKNIRNQREVSQRVRQFYTDPESVVGAAKLELQAKAK